MFERKSMEEMLDRMIQWSRGISPKLTDFRVGSNVRTIYETVAVTLEEMYDRIYRSLRALIEQNIYSIVGFDKIPATFASGDVTFSRSTDAAENYLIVAGTTVLSRASEFSAPMKYQTIADVVMASGTSSVTATVVCVQAGSIGNIGAGDIVDFVTKPIGIDFVTNLNAFTNGKDEESLVNQKARFQTFIESNARGVLQSIQYGATGVSLVDANGIVTESVVQAIATEDLPARKGEVDVYLWNGVGTASEALKTEVVRILTGYTDPVKGMVYGYKPAGIQVNPISATVKNIQLQVTVAPSSGFTVASLQSAMDSEILDYMSTLTLSQAFIRSALQARIKFLKGVDDVTISVSTDGGVTYAMVNVVPNVYEIVLLGAPTTYVAGVIA